VRAIRRRIGEQIAPIDFIHLCRRIRVRSKAADQVFRRQVSQNAVRSSYQFVLPKSAAGKESVARIVKY
jgi:hypothetical protein